MGFQLGNIRHNESSKRTNNTYKNVNLQYNHGTIVHCQLNAE